MCARGPGTGTAVGDGGWESCGVQILPGLGLEACAAPPALPGQAGFLLLLLLLWCGSEHGVVLGEAGTELHLPSGAATATGLS